VSISGVRVDWPHRYLERTTVSAPTAICVLTNDVKFDIPLLRRALTLPVGYVGAVGSRHTHEERLHLLREGRCRGTATSRMASPIGLDLGAPTPEETAMSITAEIIAHANGVSGLSRSLHTSPIHCAACRDTADRKHLDRVFPLHVR
jgi:xanthine dehydrogenase accessory factor